MAISHSITGLTLAQTRTVAEVLADMETAVCSILSFTAPPPCPECLIADGKLRYAFEPSGQDHYLGWWAWPMVPLSQWNTHQEDLWDHISPASAQPIPKSGIVPPGWTAIDDCDGAGTHATAWHRSRGLRAWPMVQEFRSQDRLRGWHALAVLEIPAQWRHPAEIPLPPNAFVMDHPWPVKARPGFRLVVVDLAWMAGMPRAKEGRYPLDRLALRRINPL